VGRGTGSGVVYIAEHGWGGEGFRGGKLSCCEVGSA
jgi:hypothetical protein